jgi:hypothetical protein
MTERKRVLIKESVQPAQHRSLLKRKYSPFAMSILFGKHFGNLTILDAKNTDVTQQQMRELRDIERTYERAYQFLNLLNDKMHNAEPM